VISDEEQGKGHVRADANLVVFDAGRVTDGFAQMVLSGKAATVQSMTFCAKPP
jgi:hypothetical protein